MINLIDFIYHSKKKKRLYFIKRKAFSFDNETEDVNLVNLADKNFYLHTKENSFLDKINRYTVSICIKVFIAVNFDTFSYI